MLAFAALAVTFAAAPDVKTPNFDACAVPVTSVHLRARGKKACP